MGGRVYPVGAPVIDHLRAYAPLGIGGWAVWTVGMAGQSLPVALTGVALWLWLFVPVRWRLVPVVATLAVAGLYGGLVGSWPHRDAPLQLEDACAYLLAASPEFYDKGAHTRPAAQLARCGDVLHAEARNV